MEAKRAEGSETLLTILLYHNNRKCDDTPLILRTCNNTMRDGGCDDLNDNEDCSDSPTTHIGLCCLRSFSYPQLNIL
jgi:hypothetical protein